MSSSKCSPLLQVPGHRGTRLARVPRRARAARSRGRAGAARHVRSLRAGRPVGLAGLAPAALRRTRRAGLRLWRGSVGMFGFLSKAHSTSSLETDSVQLKLDAVNDKLKSVEFLITEQETRRQELQDVIDTMIANGNPRNAEKTRNSQLSERQAIDSKLAELRQKRTDLKIEANGIQGTVMHLEADVGPIKYLAQLVYGEGANKSVMDKAIQILIIALVCVIDPLAIALVLAASWTRQFENAKKDEEIKPVEPVIVAEPEKQPEVVVAKPKRKYTRRKKVEEVVSTEVTKPTEVVSTQPDKLVDLDEPVIVNPSAKTSTSKPAKQSFAPKFDIQTKQIIRTFNKGEYIQHNGKKTNIRAVRQSNPEWFLESQEAEKASMIQFSAENWPQYAEVGDKFHRIDVLPHVKYEFTNAGWVEINNQIDPMMLVSVDGYTQAISKLIKAKWFKISDFDPSMRTIIKQST